MEERKSGEIPYLLYEYMWKNENLSLSMLSYRRNTCINPPAGIETIEAQG